MNKGERKQARLLLIATINELPLDAHLNVSVHDLRREDYDALPGEREWWSDVSRRWSKRIEAEGLTVDLFTTEPPAHVINITGRPQLHGIDGGAA